MAAQVLSAAARLRRLLAQDGLLIAPGAYDCISARTIEQAGFSAVYMTRAGTAATFSSALTRRCYPSTEAGARGCRIEEGR